MKFSANTQNPPLSALIVLKATKIKGVTVEWNNKTELVLDDPSQKLTTSASICRYFAKQSTGALYGSSVMEECEIDHWISFATGPVGFGKVLTDCVTYLDNCLAPVTYLVGKECSIADIILWCALREKSEWQSLIKKGEAPSHLARWYSLIESLDFVEAAVKEAPTVTVDSSKLESLRKEDAKFVDLPGAKMGEVVVRFPPEASGYLHIGHAKAALLNQYYKEAFNGKLIMRFDDTNPAKEKVDFEKVILEDLELLQIKPDVFTYTSNYFELMLDMCEKLIKDGKAYVDDTDPETMKKEREQKQESANRTNSVQKNLQMWNDMKAGSEKGQKCCVRAKIDMNSPNGCMRDPTIYRCKNEHHPRTGDKYKVYPTYDFACPIVDSIEEVTHCLRTMEYHDRDEQFYWFIDALGLRKPYIWEYSRLNMTNTVLSKRKLTWFVENQLVDGWDDPRFPTVRGVLRRGMTVEGLKQFVIAQGSSRSVVVMEWDKIWAFNKKVIDPVAPRYTGVHATDRVLVSVSGVKETSMKVAKHPKNQEVGEKVICVGPRVYIDEADANDIKEGENVTFINWGNLLIEKIIRKGDKVTEIKAKPNLENKDYKKTLKVTWLAETPNAPFIPCVCVYFDHIISKPVLGKEEDFKTYIGHSTKAEVEMIGESELAKVKKSEIIQLQRKGFFICDSPYTPVSSYTGRESPIILFFIPDGHTKQTPAGNIFQKAPSETPQPKSDSSASDLDSQIKAQGDVVRDLKQKKADKAALQPEIQKLLKLKEQYKSVTGEEWKPGAAPPAQAATQAPASSNIVTQLKKIQEQGDKIRQMKQNKADKSVIDSEVQLLKKLKEEYKTLSGTEWKQDEYKKVTGEDWKPTESVPAKPVKTEVSALDLSNQIKEVGDKIRVMKAEKADKNLIADNVKVLVGLKASYKEVTGQDWKPTEVAPPSQVKTDSSALDLSSQIKEVGDKIRSMKAEKADKNLIADNVKVLVSLKASYKEKTGQDWKPEEVPKAEPVVNDKVTALTYNITEQGNIVRKLKSTGADKEVITSAVQKLLDLKGQYKELTGKEFPSEGGKPSSKDKGKEQKKKEQPKAPAKAEKKQPAAGDTQSGPKKVTRLGLEAKKEENLPDWYSQVIVKGEMIEYHDVSGCYILRPWSYGIWEVIKDWLDKEIKKLGVKNCYFPIFVSRSVLEKEKTHIEDFAPEVAWVTKSGESDLAEPIAIRPTSETAMYPAYAKWIQSHRDLPLKLNQWNNVVRWEFKHPQPFLRTREFLWQEGHTAYALADEAVQEVRTILNLYAQVYTDLLAVPVVKGRKTEKEKFAGADFTLTVEAFISASGRGIQGATSHHLGQNFSKMFEIIYEDPVTKEKKFVYQNSWGLTTRTIGVMIMIHSDNQGLVLPPRVASVQVVIVPCGLTASLPEKDKDELLKACEGVESGLKNAGVLVQGDYRNNYSPGWKFNHWELKGVPIRLEIGPKDLKASQVVAVRRDTGAQQVIKMNNVVEDIKSLLETIHSSMLKKATDDLTSHTKVCKSWNDFCQKLDERNIILAPFCGAIPCEEWIKANSARTEAEDSNAPSMGAKSLCIPQGQPARISASDKCINPNCKTNPPYYTLFGRSY